MVSDLDFALPTSITRRRDVFPLGSHPFFLRPPDFARPGFLPVSGINTPETRSAYTMIFLVVSPEERSLDWGANGDDPRGVPCGQ